MKSSTIVDLKSVVAQQLLNHIFPNLNSLFDVWRDVGRKAAVEQEGWGGGGGGGSRADITHHWLG